MDILSPGHLLILLLIILIVFGPSKLGDVGGALGKAIKDFKHAMNDDPTHQQAQKVAEQPKAPTEANPVKPA
jgi:sec-independent protein translocase protein TatA